MEFFVSLTGDDTNPGSQEKPFRTIARGLRGASPTSTLQAGDVLTLRGGTYIEAVRIANLAGTPGNEITIRSFSGERAVIDSCLPQFRSTGAGAWVKAATLDSDAHPDEWASAQPIPSTISPTRGAFVDPPYRRLVTYSTERDFRSNSQAFDKIFDVDPPDLTRSPWKVTDELFVPLRDPDTGREFTFPWVFMGPGLFNNRETGRVHVRLSHTTLDIPGLQDYRGATDPNQLELAICDAGVPTLRIENSRCLNFSNLTIRFGGRDTIFINRCHCLAFDEVDVFASSGGIRVGELRGATFGHCRFDGGCPPWFFRADRKGEYFALQTPNGERLHNTRGKSTIDVLMYGDGFGRRDFEIHHCEFVNGHDLYLVASNMHFHHNWIDNLHDEGMMLDAQPSASGRIHSNVITRCLSPISMAIEAFTAGPWFIYRNLVDLRAPTAGIRPRFAGDIAVFRFGNVFKSNERPAPDGPHDLFHNTFLVAEQKGQAAYLHYRSDLSPHLRRSFNNIFIAVNPTPASDVALSFVPPPSFPGPTDGNLYHRFGAANAPLFRFLVYTFDCRDVRAGSFASLVELHKSTLFQHSKEQYPPGYEANSVFGNPLFRRIAPNGRFHPLDDLRLRPDSPARGAGVALPPDLQALDDAVGSGGSRDVGCYRFGSKPISVGVHGRRRFPIIGTTP